MVIERALEKMRQAAAAKAAGSPSVRPRESVSQKSALSNGADARPLFPQCKYDARTASLHRLVWPDTQLAENARAVASYRMIRTRLLHLSRTKNLKSIAITSPGPGDGKSVTSLNIAYSLARDPTTSVFLIDLDMRNPSICRYLGIQPPVDLLRYFNGESSASEVFFSAGPVNLAIAGSLSSTDVASELLGAGALERLLDYISSICTDPIILLDLPPVLVTDEALLVAPRVDAVLLVVAEGKTHRDSLSRAVNMLAEFPSVGVVLNRAAQAMDGNGYYYGYK